jgi:hypothetical protein
LLPLTSLADTNPAALRLLLDTPREHAGDSFFHLGTLAAPMLPQLLAAVALLWLLRRLHGRWRNGALTAAHAAMAVPLSAALCIFLIAAEHLTPAGHGGWYGVELQVSDGDRAWANRGATVATVSHGSLALPFPDSASSTALGVITGDDQQLTIAAGAAQRAPAFTQVIAWQSVPLSTAPMAVDGVATVFAEEGLVSVTLTNRSARELPEGSLWVLRGDEIRGCEVPKLLPGARWQSESKLALRGSATVLRAAGIKPGPTTAIYLTAEARPPAWLGRHCTGTVYRLCALPCRQIVQPRAPQLQAARQWLMQHVRGHWSPNRPPPRQPTLVAEPQIPLTLKNGSLMLALTETPTPTAVPLNATLRLRWEFAADDAAATCTVRVWDGSSQRWRSAVTMTRKPVAEMSDTDVAEALARYQATGTDAATRTVSLPPPTPAQPHRWLWIDHRGDGPDVTVEHLTPAADVGAHLLKRLKPADVTPEDGADR